MSTKQNEQILSLLRIDAEHLVDMEKRMCEVADAMLNRLDLQAGSGVDGGKTFQIAELEVFRLFASFHIFSNILSCFQLLSSFMFSKKKNIVMCLDTATSSRKFVVPGISIDKIRKDSKKATIVVSIWPLARQRFTPAFSFVRCETSTVAP